MKQGYDENHAIKNAVNYAMGQISAGLGRLVITIQYGRSLREIIRAASLKRPIKSYREKNTFFWLITVGAIPSLSTFSKIPVQRNDQSRIMS